MNAEWSNELVVEQFKREVHQRFEAENAKVRAEEAAEIARLSAAPDWEARMRDPNFAAGMTVRDSFFWEIYRASIITSHHNSVFFNVT